MLSSHAQLVGFGHQTIEPTVGRQRSSLIAGSLEFSSQYLDLLVSELLARQLWSQVQEDESERRQPDW